MAWILILDKASATGLSVPLTWQMSDVNCEIKSRWWTCLGEYLLELKKKKTMLTVHDQRIHKNSVLQHNVRNV